MHHSSRRRPCLLGCLGLACALSVVAALAVAPAGAAPGSTVAADRAPATVADGGTYYVGQELRRSAGVGGVGRLDLLRAGSFVTAVAVRNGTARTDTDRLAPGRYALAHTNGTTVASFRLVDHTVGASFDAADVTNAGGNAAADLALRSNRRGTVHYLTARLDGSRLDGSTLASALGKATTVDADRDGDDDAVRVAPNGTETTLTLNATGLRAGDLSATTYAPSTGASATATLRIARGGPGSAEMSPRVVTADQGAVVALGVRLTATSSATAAVGSAAQNYNVSMVLQDGDGDGTVTVEWNTSDAGVSTDEADAWTARGADAVTDVQRHTPRLRGALVPDVYDVGLRVEGRETGFGSVTLITPSSPGNVSFQERVRRHAERYNANASGLPPGLGFVADERVNLVVATEDGNETVGVVMEGERVGEVRGALDDPTLVVETTDDVVRRVDGASDPAGVATEALADGRITYDGVGVLNRAKWGAVGVAQDAMAFVGEHLGVGPFG